MESTKELQRKYNSLLEEKQTIGLSIAKSETKIEALLEEEKKLEKQILEEAGVDSVEEAKIKIKKLKDKLSKLLEEAEDLLDGQ